jgi:hypothetical protein
LLKRSFLLVLISLAVLIAPAQAQETPSLENLLIDLWPEYDDPGMLVIYKASLSPEVALPAELTFRIPVEAGKPFVVAVGPDANSVDEVVYDTQMMGDWIDVSFIATTPAIQLEYYDPRLVKDGAQRTFHYTWPGDYAAQDSRLQIQHPLGSSGMSVKPPMGNVVQGDYGFNYSVIDVGALEADANFDIDLSYQKETDELSNQSLQIQPSATITPGSSNLLNLDQWWVWLLVGLGVVLIGGGGYWYWRLGREEAPSKKHSRRRISTPSTNEGTLERVIYCHQCGKRAEHGDRFCRSCGTRLRTE